jgi:hypothetical protein
LVSSWSFGAIFPILVFCTKTNLATLVVGVIFFVPLMMHDFWHGEIVSCDETLPQKKFRRENLLSPGLPDFSGTFYQNADKYTK